MGTYSRLDEGLRRVVARVAVLNLTYFGVEFSERSQSVRFLFSPIASTS